MNGAKEAILDTMDDYRNTGWTSDCEYYYTYINWVNNCKDSGGVEDAKVGFWSGCNQNCTLTYQNGPISFVLNTSFLVRYLVGPVGRMTVTSRYSNGTEKVLLIATNTGWNWRMWSYQFKTGFEPDLVSLFEI
jgi:hypothetical protein